MLDLEFDPSYGEGPGLTWKEWCAGFEKKPNQATGHSGEEGDYIQVGTGHYLLPPWQEAEEYCSPLQDEV
jgi:hypothetical protein